MQFWNTLFEADPFFAWCFMIWIVGLCIVAGLVAVMIMGALINAWRRERTDARRDFYAQHFSLPMLLALCSMLFMGCSSVQYRNATTGDQLSYTRIGMSKIGKMTVEPTQGGGFAMSLEGFESDGSSIAIQSLATTVSQLATSAATP